ncbi:MAG: response regulator [Methyloceanibacter sp.]|jgi:CheY-like chemotaxis protein
MASMAAKRILVVEDEFLIALDIAGALEQAGHTVIGPMGSIRDALQALERQAVDGALLDANLGGEPVGRLADLLRARGVPFAFVSGYGRDQLPPAHQSAPLVRKPFTGEDLLAVVARFVSVS